MKDYYRHKGFALAGALMFLLLVMIMWLGVTRQIGTNLNVEEHLQTQKSYYNGCIRALSWGLTLSETGYPPMAFMEFTKSYWVLVGADGQQKFVITYERKAPYWDFGPPFEWLYNYDVTARPFVSGTDDSVPPAPSSFGS